MSIRYEIYDGTKTYMYPNGKIATPEVVLEDFPATDVFPHVVEISGNVLQAIYELGSIKNIKGIPENTSNEETLVLLQNAYEAALSEIPGPSAEERIAAALEFNNLLAMGDA